MANKPKAELADLESIIQTILSAEWKLAEWSTYKDFVGVLKKEAGEKYAANCDQEAEWLRDLATRFEDKAKKLRETYDAEWKDKKGEAWAETDKYEKKSK